MMVILFLAAILFAIPTAGVSLLAFLVVAFGKAHFRTRGRIHDANHKEAIRDLQSGVVGNRPSWIGTSEEEVFFNGVVKFANRQAVPISFAATGFASPEASSVLFELAANLERKGSSFIEQQISVANFVYENWGELSHGDREIFREMDREALQRV